MPKMKPWQPPTAAEVRKKWDDIIEDMLDARRQFMLNREYFMGNQWLTWEDKDSRVDVIPFEDTEDADSRVTVNKMKPRTLSLLARLTQTPLTFEPRPNGVDQQAQKLAHLQQQVLDVEAHRNDWEQIRADLVLDVLLGGVAAVAVEPDWEYDAETIIDVTTGAHLQIPKRPAVRLTELSALEFGLEPGTRKDTDARYWMRATTLTPEQAQERYDLEQPPSVDADAFATSTLHKSLTAQRKGAGLRRDANVVLVLVYYERPSKRGPGCILHVIGNQIVQQSAWPFAFTDRLNVRTFTQTPIGATWKGDTVLNDARQLQRTYNKAFTSINRHVGRADNAQLIVPQGAVIGEDDEFTGNVGAIIRVDPQAGSPSWLQAPQVPRWIREHLEKIEMEFDDLFSTHAVSRGQAPGDRNSGLALSILAEKDETPLGPMAKNQQRGWQGVAEMVLSTMRVLMEGVDAAVAKAGLDATMRVEDVHMGRNITDVDTEISWTAADLPANPVVHVPLEAVTPRSHAAMQDAMFKLAQAFPQIFEGMTPQQIATIMRTPDTTAFVSVSNPQMDLAAWENTRMIAGVGDEEVAVDDWHDHQVHIDKHNELRAGAGYRTAPPEVQEYIDLHIEAHKTLQQQMAMAAMQAQMQQQQMMQPPMPPEAAPEQDPVAEGMPA